MERALQEAEAPAADAPSFAFLPKSMLPTGFRQENLILISVGKKQPGRLQE
jgi:hypothetical protein